LTPPSRRVRLHQSQLRLQCPCMLWVSNGTRLPSSAHDGTRTVPAMALVVRRHPTVAPGQHAAFASSTRRFLYSGMNQA
jgi:hypothetical protein